MQHFKSKIEHYQIYIYFVALVLGILAGLTSQIFSIFLESVISIFIGILMFSMFSQIPFFNIRQNLFNTKYIIALILSNFIIIPIFVFTLIQLFEVSSAPILIGLYLVLLTPCIDYVIVFTALGKGNAQYMLISTPILFVLQIILLPVYFTIFLNNEILSIIDVAPFINAFFTFIIIPLMLALLLQLLSKKSNSMNRVLNLTAWLPELFMSLVLFSVVGSQINKITNDLNIVLTVVPIYICFMIIAPIIGLFCGKLFRLDIPNLRTLAFSTSTRNALVVLPLALSLPNHWVTITTTVIITQTLTELIGELVYIKVIPKLIK
ncbi:arsenic resistance protein [Staphylococcus equorum]|uniref:arsenic resistance protein n=1 Tax=Staphylococcus equorum TaxID=246432 RepID=UPI000D1C3B4A|nr:bile acid:sodium symporter [Staphylococcus equorum]PTE82631.1 arsenic resistance protein [Staphylococcus equorum]PTF09912.1 arsenic resistance protein [Staphylococcus equorum]RIL46116.1 arsenic resistance protein [Staphylococcus equorum]